MEKDVPYVTGGHARQVLDLFVAEHPLPGAPVMLFVHGGGWKRFSKKEHANVGRSMAARGITTAVMSYRVSAVNVTAIAGINLVTSLSLGSLGFLADVTGVAPGWQVAAGLAGGLFAGLMAISLWKRHARNSFAKWPEHRDDVGLALEFLGRAAGDGGEFEGLYDPHNMFVMGHSAGAHMTLMAMMDSEFVARHGVTVLPSSDAALPEVGLPIAAAMHRPAGGGSSAAAGSVPRPLASPGVVVRGIVAVSPPATASLMLGWFTRTVYLLPVFGQDPAKWEACFPDALVRSQAEAGTCSAPGLLLVNADPGMADMWLDSHADVLEVALARAGVPCRRLTVAGSNHFSEVMSLDVPDSAAERILAPAVEAWVRALGAKA